MAKIAREMVEKAGHGRGHGPLLTFALCRPYRAVHEKLQIPGAYETVSFAPWLFHGAPSGLRRSCSLFPARRSREQLNSGNEHIDQNG